MYGNLELLSKIQRETYQQSCRAIISLSKNLILDKSLFICYRSNSIMKDVLQKNSNL